MAVRVTLSIEFDWEDWILAFGVTKPSAIRTDVRAYVLSLAQEGGVFGNGEVPAEVRIEG